MHKLYKHKQEGYLIWAILVCVLLIFSGFLLYSNMYDAIGMGAIVIISLITLILLNFTSLTVQIEPEVLKIYFGPGLIRKHIVIDTIRYYQAVQTPWYWGYGIRLFPGGVLWNVSGSQAIDLFLKDGSRFRLGTDDSDGLIQALVNQTGVLSPLSDDEISKIKVSTRRLWMSITGVVFFVISMIAVFFYMQIQPPKVVMNAHQIQISNFYSFEANYNEIKHVKLLDQLPKIEVRTNGFSAFGVLRGYFSLADLGIGSLFIHKEVAPFILIKTNKKYVLINDENSEKTKALYQKIKVALDQK
jgi:hypothetical protein